MAEINLKNIKAFIQGNYRLIVDKLPKEFIPRLMKLPVYKREQVAYRSEVCGESCKTKCSYCGCSTPGKWFVDKECGAGKYPNMMDEQSWEQFKKNNDINK
jgi:hypothetical protein